MWHDGTAEEIADKLLFETGRGIMEGKYELFRSCFDLPNVIETAHCKRVVESEHDFRKTFDDVRRNYQQNGIIDAARLILSAKFLAADIVGSTHVSSLMLKNGELFRKPYPVYSIIRKRAGLWKIVSSTYAILDWPEMNATLVSATPPISQ
ncbi:MAG: hypothetical protein AAGA74_04920 [Pseudomonadota bacterium]